MNLALREVWFALRRAPLLALLSITTIAFSLFSFGLFGLVALNIRSALRSIEDRVEVRAFLVDNAREGSVDALIKTMQKRAEVADVGYVSPDSALQRARVELEEFRDVMDGSVLPGSIEVRLKEGRRDPETIRTLSGVLSSSPLVEEVRYGREWVEKLYKIRTIAAIAGAGLGIVFAMVAVIVIGATIRVAILARTREIEIMRMVGATNAFVRLPYVIDGACKGLIGGIMAALLTYLANGVISRSLVATEFFSPPQVALFVVAGTLIGCVGSWVSVGRHLRQSWREA